VPVTSMHAANGRSERQVAARARLTEGKHHTRAADTLLAPKHLILQDRNAQPIG
jgi:hypothetical protein